MAASVRASSKGCNLSAFRQPMNFEAYFESVTWARRQAPCGQSQGTNLPPPRTTRGSAACKKIRSAGIAPSGAVPPTSATRSGPSARSSSWERACRVSTPQIRKALGLHKPHWTPSKWAGSLSIPMKPNANRGCCEVPMTFNWKGEVWRNSTDDEDTDTTCEWYAGIMGVSLNW